MDRATKLQLIAVVAVALIVIIVAWWFKTRQRFYQSVNLTGITYDASRAPYLTFTFSQPLPAGQVAGTSALLKGFQVGAGSPTPPAVAAAAIGALVKGAPFVPDPLARATEVTTNTVPVGMPAAPMRITGSGTMWFYVPTAPS